jgi:hypothetical protein
MRASQKFLYMRSLTLAYMPLYTPRRLMDVPSRASVHKGMVQGSSKTAPNDRPLGSDFALWTMPETDRTSGDKKRR